jgi:cytochrome c-type biogenesis protein CcmE
VIASKNTIYYYTTSETQDIEITTNERIKLGGFVVEDSVTQNDGFTVFTITDGNKEIEIVFDGFIPELFQENMGVILDGVFENNTFVADDMLVKHDNEYVSSDGETYDVKNYSK